jgi:hypothetical protein
MYEHPTALWATLTTMATTSSDVRKRVIGRTIRLLHGQIRQLDAQV